jgi:hypothetical protein
MLTADEARHQADAIRAGQEREWAAYERRNPGVAHPDRTRAQIERQRAAKAAEERRFTRTPPTVAEMGRAQRQLQRRPVSDPGPLWDDNDPDLMEPPHMIDMGNWRAGRKW